MRPGWPAYIGGPIPLACDGGRNITRRLYHPLGSRHIISLWCRHCSPVMLRHSDGQEGQQVGQGAVRHVVEDHSQIWPMPTSLNPSHVGIAGNGAADALKGTAENSYTHLFTIPARFLPSHGFLLTSRWQETCDQSLGNKLYATKPKPSHRLPSVRWFRRKKVIIFTL